MTLTAKIQIIDNAIFYRYNISQQLFIIFRKETMEECKIFGYITAAPSLLSDKDKIRYRGWYCGLCKSLGSCCGQSCRFLLTYDMSFLAMLLASVYDMPESSADNRCILHPIKSHNEIYTESSNYAADMNVILAYYKLLDDWHDDKNLAALAASTVFKGKCENIHKRYPRQHKAITGCLSELSELEKAGEVNPDLPANCFGKLMGELFVIDDKDSLAQSLRLFGHTLGRFIYIIDAATDLRDDLKKERYNPLVGIPSDIINEMLQVMGGDFMRAFQQLPIESDRDLMGNILCAGIWCKYEMQQQKYQKKEKDINGKKSV